LDFFAGSGTSAHAVMSQNVADSGTRRYITVQLPEPLDTSDKEQKTAANYCDQLGKPRTIAELTKERLRRAGQKIKAEAEAAAAGRQPSLLDAVSGNKVKMPDVGFRVFKLDSSNIREWEGRGDNLATTLLDAIEHLKADRSEQDILYEVLLKLGLDLCVPIATRTVAGKQAHAVGGGVLLACLAPSITRAEVEELALGLVAWLHELAPAGDTTCIFRDSSFADDVAKTNLAAILNQHGIANVRSL